jgi:hypothetical protein
MITPIVTKEIPEAKATNPGQGSLNEPRRILQLRKQMTAPMMNQTMPSFILTCFIYQVFYGR